MAKSSKTARARINDNGYRLCDPLAKGTTLRDSSKKEWVVGDVLGSGGFGEIYLCRQKGSSTPFVMKADNLEGPLFSEVNFYLRVGKSETIADIMTKNGLKHLGMPRYISSGIYIKDKNAASTNNNTKTKKGQISGNYRFLVMPRFGEDLQKSLFHGPLLLKTAALIGCQMIDVLHYIHDFGYIHCDLKAPNILNAGSGKGRAVEQYYLVDYGNADMYSSNGKHREEKPDKKRANNGTVEFRSRDAHIGLLSRRSDIECLSYNVLLWTGDTLPWLDKLKDADKVYRDKETYMDNIDLLLKKCFKSKVPKGFKEFLDAVAKLDYSEKPNYARLKQLLETISKNDTSKPTTKRSPTKRTRKVSTNGCDDDSDSSPKKPRNGRVKLGKKVVVDISDDSEPEVSRASSDDILLTADNPTPAMLALMKRIKEKEKVKATKTKRSTRK